MNYYLTDKMIALSHYLNVNCDLIRTKDDIQFYIEDDFDDYYLNNSFYVFNERETIDRLYQYIVEEMFLSKRKLKLKDVAYSLNIEVDDIKEFFLVEIILGEVRLTDYIHTHLLLRFLEGKDLFYTFAQTYAEFVFYNNESYSILSDNRFSFRTDNVVNGYHIFPK